MKRYRSLFLLLLAALSMTSCLDEHPKDQLDEDAIYGSASDIYINAVASLYNYIGGANESEGIQGTCRGIYDYNTLTTDEAMIRFEAVTGMMVVSGMPCTSIGGVPMTSLFMIRGSTFIRLSCWLISLWILSATSRPCFLPHSRRNIGLR